MKKIKVYDIRIAEGEFRGLYCMTSIGQVNNDGALERARQLKAHFENDRGVKCEIIEREIDAEVDFNDLF